MTLEELNAATPEVAGRELERCCGSSPWVREMVARRPFADETQLYTDAAQVWWSLSDQEWREAFAHHPRIGDRAGGWAAEEQSGVRAAGSETMRRFVRRNEDYERRFGHVFLICATGRSADEMLAQLEQRMTNEASAELRVAAAEQLKITRLRLEKLIHPQPSKIG